MRTYKRQLSKINLQKEKYVKDFKDRFHSKFLKKEITIFHYTLNHVDHKEKKSLNYILKRISDKISALHKKDEKYKNINIIDYLWFLEVSSSETKDKITGARKITRNQHLHILVFTPFFCFKNQTLDKSGLNLDVSAIWSASHPEYSQLHFVSMHNGNHLNNIWKYFYKDYAFIPKHKHLIGCSKQTKQRITNDNRNNWYYQ